MSDAEDQPKPKRKKGVKNTGNYKRNVIKKARLHGVAYVNYSGKPVPAIKYKTCCTYDF